MQIGIIGLGFVGLAFASVLGSKGYPVIGVDTNPEKIKMISNNKAPFFEPKLDLFLKNYSLKHSMTWQQFENTSFYIKTASTNITFG